MSFLHHNENKTNEAGALYCTEGNQVRNCRAVKVANPPGGRQSFNIFSGYEPEPAQQQSQRRLAPRNNDAGGVTGKITGAAVPSQQVASEHVSRGQSGQQSQPAPQSALFCSEGSQVRSCRSVKVANPPGGKSSLNLFGGN